MTNQSQHDVDTNSLQVLADAVSAAIKDNKGDQRFIDLARLPLICLAQAHQAKSIEELKVGILKALDELKNMIKKNKEDSDEQHETFLTKENFHLEFDTVKLLVFGVVGLSLVAMAGALISLVVQS